MTIRNWVDKFLDLSIVFSFDQSGFKRHCSNPLKTGDLLAKRAIVTGASSGIGLGVAKGLISQGMNCDLIARHPEKILHHLHLNHDCILPTTHSLDMSCLKKVYTFAQNIQPPPLDLIVHNAGDMPLSLQITEEGFEQMFASQVLAPFILTKTLADSGKLQQGCRIIFVSSAGMYLQKLDLSDLLFKKKPYNKYAGYANAKRAQVILCELFCEKYPHYLFSSMHPGWVDTPGVRYSLPTFSKILTNRLRTTQEGADTILWLGTEPDYPNGKFWFDRKQVKPTIFNFFDSTNKEKQMLWDYCESILALIRGE